MGVKGVEVDEKLVRKLRKNTKSQGKNIRIGARNGGRWEVVAGAWCLSVLP